MSTTRPAIPIIALVGLALISVALASAFTEENRIVLSIVIFLLGVLLFLIARGAGIRRVERGTFVVRKDFFGGAEPFEEGAYLYIPYLHTIEAMMPNYLLRYEFPIAEIDTNTPGLKQIKSIKVRVIYRLVARSFCTWLYPGLFSGGRQRQQARGPAPAGDAEIIEGDPYAFIRRRVQELDESLKLKPDNPELWIRITAEVLQYILDDMIRDAVWGWNDAENDPYALNRNRKALADQVRADLDGRTQKWGLRVQGIVFENIVIDEEIIKGKTRNKDREIENAEHDAKKEAVGITAKGMAEAKVRAAAVAEIIAQLMGEKQINISDEVLFKIVQAAMYSDGQMIWSATMEKGGAQGEKPK